MYPVSNHFSNFDLIRWVYTISIDHVFTFGRFDVKHNFWMYSVSNHVSNFDLISIDHVFFVLSHVIVIGIQIVFTFAEFFVLSHVIVIGLQIVFTFAAFFVLYHVIVIGLGLGLQIVFTFAVFFVISFLSLFLTNNCWITKCPNLN